MSKMLHKHVRLISGVDDHFRGGLSRSTSSIKFATLSRAGDGGLIKLSRPEEINSTLLTSISSVLFRSQVGTVPKSDSKVLNLKKYY